MWEAAAFAPHPFLPPYDVRLTRRFILLVPLNLFGLAQATTSALTLLLPAYKAFVVLENGGHIDNLLAYFIVLGYFQMLETFMLHLLVSQIRKSARGSREASEPGQGGEARRDKRRNNLGAGK